MLSRWRLGVRRDGGFSLVEVMVATVMLATSLTALAELFAISVRNTTVARNGTFTAVLAAQKVEQLRGRTDLVPSTVNTLQANTDGYVDYLDPSGNPLGGGTVVPNNTAYIRRWCIEPLPGSQNTLVLQVLVTRRRDRGDADAGSVVRAPEEARLLTLKPRNRP